jgi:hypothetical protein
VHKKAAKKDVLQPDFTLKKLEFGTTTTTTLYFLISSFSKL